MIRTLAYPLFMLVLIVVALVRREVAWCIGAGALALGAQVVVRRAWRTAAGGLAIANLLTILRLAIVVSLPWLLSSTPRLLFVALVIGILILDGVDGRVARTRGEVSAFGASLDMETDALTVMVLTILLWTDANMGPWVLMAGLWRYAHALLVGLAPALGDVPRSPIYRWIFCALMIALAGAFLPWATIARASAAIGTTLVSFSFLHSLVRSRAFRREPTGSVQP